MGSAEVSWRSTLVGLLSGLYLASFSQQLPLGLRVFAGFVLGLWLLTMWKDVRKERTRLRIETLLKHAILRMKSDKGVTLVAALGRITQIRGKNDGFAFNLALLEKVVVMSGPECQPEARAVLDAARVLSGQVGRPSPEQWKALLDACVAFLHRNNTTLKGIPFPANT